MAFLGYFLRRLSLVIPTLLGVTIITFTLTYVLPGNPAVVTLRGFSGGAVSILQDGVRISTSTVVQRDTNVWHFDRIEVIKGPASVLYC